MNIEIDDGKLLQEMEPGEIDALFLRSIVGGKMKMFIRKLRAGNLKEDILVFRATSNNFLVGWCYLQFAKNLTFVGVYVPRQYRNRNIGSRLMSKAEQHFGDNIKSEPWNKLGRKFFDKHGISYG